MEFGTSKIYPGIPEYFNAEGRGMYHYLTGAASWYLFTFLTEVFGIRGKDGNLEICPALMGQQFDGEGKAGAELMFANKRFRILMENPKHLEYGHYRIRSAVMEGRKLPLTELREENGSVKAAALLSKEDIGKLSGGMQEIHKIEIVLDA